MSTLFFLLFLISGFCFLLGLAKPSLVIKWSKNPSRKGVLLYFFLPSILFLFLFYSNYESSLDKALKDPINAIELSINRKKLETIPDEILQFKNLRNLDLSKNNFTTIPLEIQQFAKLETLNMSGNPITEIPKWLYDMENLYSVELNNTKIIEFPTLNPNKDLTFKYDNTPLAKSEMAPEKDNSTTEFKNDNNELNEDLSTTKSSSPKDDRTESFGEFAFRSILGNDYGQKRKFGKGELYYDDPVTRDEADGIGEALETLGLFNAKNEVSMLLDKDFDDNDSAFFMLKMVVKEIDEIDAETMETFEFIRQMISSGALENKPLHIHLTNGEFETQKILKP